MLCTRPGGEVVAAFSDQKLHKEQGPRPSILVMSFPRIAPRGRRKPERSPDRFCADAAKPVEPIPHHDRDG